LILRTRVSCVLERIKVVLALGRACTEVRVKVGSFSPIACMAAGSVEDGDSAFAIFCPSHPVFQSFSFLHGVRITTKRTAHSPSEALGILLCTCVSQIALGVQMVSLCFCTNGVSGVQTLVRDNSLFLSYHLTCGSHCKLGALAFKTPVAYYLLPLASSASSWQHSCTLSSLPDFLASQAS
jgi:hypothetical protein